MCSPSGTAPGAPATVSSAPGPSPSPMNANGTPAPPMAPGAASGAPTSTGAAGASGGVTPGAGGMFAALAIIQAMQAVSGAYGGHQNWKAQQYVNDVRSRITTDNANASLKAASAQQAAAESTDKTAEGIDMLTSKINALRSRSSIKTAAGESGITGTTPSDILSNADRIQATREGILQMNYDSRRRERLAQRRGISAAYLNNLAGASTPYLPNPVNYGATGLEIAGHGLSGYMDYQQANRQGASNAQGVA